MWHEALKTDSSLTRSSATVEGAKPDAEFGFCDKILALDSERDEWVAFALVKNQTESRSDHSALSGLEEALSKLEGSNGRPGLGLMEAEAESWFGEAATTLGRIANLDREEASSTTNSLSRKRSKSLSGAQMLGKCLPRLRPDDDQEVYKAKVEAAREYIASGESYELCLTTQFRGSLPPLPESSFNKESLNQEIRLELARELDLDHFSMYKALRARNPAPYSAFFHLPRLGSSNLRERSILCTSPERFMRVSRTGEVEMKPIKGTLARAGWGKGEDSMRPIGVGDQISGSPIGDLDERKKKEWRDKEDEKRRKSLAADVKERAENLMVSQFDIVLGTDC